MATEPEPEAGEAKDPRCKCFTDAKGRHIRVLLCPIHGDLKARKGEAEEARASASSLKRKKGLDRSSKRINPTSNKEDLRQAYLQGAKDSVLLMMIDANGVAYCQLCETDVELPEGATLEGARSALDQHHQDVKRSEGKGYDHRNRNPGSDDPKGLIYVCRKCHRDLESKQ